MPDCQDILVFMNIHYVCKIVVQRAGAPTPDPADLLKFLSYYLRGI